MAPPSSQNRRRRNGGSFQRINFRKIDPSEDDDNSKSSALQAVEQAARDAVWAALNDSQLIENVIVSNDVLIAATVTSHHHEREQHNNRPQLLLSPSESMDFFEDDHSSYLSIERGMLRGSKRALFEENENDDNIRYTHDDGGDYFSLHDDMVSTNIATEAGTSRISGLTGSHRYPKAKKMRQKDQKPASSKKRLSSVFIRDSLLGLRNNFAQISKEAWMCGICAKSFSSFDAAEKHEEYHIKEVVMDLGWVCNPAANLSQNCQDVRAWNLNSSSSRRLSATEGSRQDVFQSAVTTCVPPNPSSKTDFRNSVSSPRPDVLTMSKRNSAPPRKDPSHPHEDFLLSKGEIPNPGSVRYERINDLEETAEYDLLLPHGMRDYIVLADEALIDVCGKAVKLILTPLEKEAEFELACYSKDKEYYDTLEEREIERRRDGAYSRFRTEGKNIAQKVQNKFVDAYALMKEGKSKKTSATVDHYTRKLKGDADFQNVITNTKETLYVNVVVKNSLQVVRHELERLARQRWEEYRAKTNEKEGINNDSRNEESRAQFERFKAAAQGNLVKLAGFALASDFTPRRIAVQLSNDLYRLLTPRLKRRGVFIETEIEYRVGAYFVLAVNILRVDWRRLVKMTHKDVVERRAKWVKESESDDAKEGVTRHYGPIASLIRVSRMTRMEMLAQFISLLYHTHWTFFTPICMLLYHLVMGETFRMYFLSSVTDEIFYYVERKGMEMNIEIKDAQDQTSFMLMALQEIRNDGRELKKKQEATGEEGDAALLGPLLGPAIKEDAGPAPEIPEGFEVPENLEFVGLEVTLQVGFRRLRWALLSSESSFVWDAVWKTESKYDNITVKDWNKHNAEIGAVKLPEGVKQEDFIGAEKECSYLMPKSAFVAANTCYETFFLEAYNDYCFSLKKKALTPDVPYGSTFEAWTKYVVINTGKNSCKMICSVEAEFPNGPPMISRQIKSGMRAGVGELFVKTGEAIQKYANAYP
ncbi:protein of unknown function DUF4782 containing protein [Nitzschia inconspicua]|uniref:C2H2-type domain-containing protein n=1 Tax=Nitzschia inconspicua TaxID=303405 RepID=A0A9K3LQD7_9STRA|nr:protein of unknown function DUF4782 containing protein [Nitzschia inconspicua]